MNPALEQLRDIHLTDPPGLWPLALGWWCVIIATLLLIAIGIWLWARGREQRRFRHAVRDELSGIEAAWQTHADPARLATELAELLRRTVRQIEPTAVALTGQAWLQTLNRLGNTDAFTRSLGQLFVQQVYAPNAAIANSETIDGDGLLQLVKEWLHSVDKNALSQKNGGANA